MSLGDNLAEVLSQERGSARSWELNAMCRVAVSLDVACSVRWACRYVESARNPSDRDSRVADRGLLARGEVWAPAGGRHAGAYHTARRAAVALQPARLAWLGWGAAAPDARRAVDEATSAEKDARPRVRTLLGPLTAQSPDVVSRVNDALLGHAGLGLFGRTPPLPPALPPGRPAFGPSIASGASGRSGPILPLPHGPGRRLERRADPERIAGDRRSRRAAHVVPRAPWRVLRSRHRAELGIRLEVPYGRPLGAGRWRGLARLARRATLRRSRHSLARRRWRHR